MIVSPALRQLTGYPRQQMGIEGSLTVSDAVWRAKLDRYAVMLFISLSILVSISLNLVTSCAMFKDDSELRASSSPDMSRSR